jgi:hypothetical protein
MIMELLTVRHGCGMNVTVDELQELMPEEVEALYDKYLEVMVDSGFKLV